MCIVINQITTLCLAVALFLVDSFLVKRIGLLNRFCTPRPVVGGGTIRYFRKPSIKKSANP